MKYCLRCLYPENHPLGITFDESGICSGCRVHEEKDTLDWRERGERLKTIFDSFRSVSGKSYDCIIPVSGARDSYFTVHAVKNIYKMHPLLVSYNKHYNTPVGIRNAAYLRTLFGCDLLTLTVSPQTVKKITRKTLWERGSLYWHCLAGQSVYPVQMAVKLKIPLIVWGAHQGCDQVGMFSHLDEVEMTRRYRKDHDLMGLEAEGLVDSARDISEQDVIPFCYPHDREIDRVGVRGIYLSNYLRWDSKAQHEEMIAQYQYQTAAQRRTFDTYNDVDCFHYSDLHDFIKYLKWGYGKVTDHACREIRLKRLTRSGAIRLVERFQPLAPSPKGTELFLSWLGMPEKEFWYTLNRFRDPKIWRQKPDGEWILLDSVINHEEAPGFQKAAIAERDDCHFQITPPLKFTEPDNQYTLIGKGWAPAPI